MKIERFEIVLPAYSDRFFEIQTDPEGSLCDASDVALLETKYTEILETLKMMAAQHYCGCDHPACKRCDDDRICHDVIVRAEEKI